MSITSYCTTAEADAYFAERSFAENWSALETAAKTKYIATASKLIQEFCTLEDTDLTDTAALQTLGLLDSFKDATCEFALHLVNLGKDPTQVLKVHTLGIVSTDGTVFSKDFVCSVFPMVTIGILEGIGVTVSPRVQGSCKAGLIVK